MKGGVANIGCVYDRGRSFFPVYSAHRDTLATFTTLNLTPAGGMAGELGQEETHTHTPGMSPTACPFLPNPAISTSSFSSTKLRQPSLGTKAVIFFPFLINWTRMHFLMAELGCLASTPLERRGRGGGRGEGRGRYNYIIPVDKGQFYRSLHQLTLSPAQCLWHERLHQMGWPLVQCPSWLSCSFCHASAGPVCAHAASWQCAVLVASLIQHTISTYITGLTY